MRSGNLNRGVFMSQPCLVQPLVFISLFALCNSIPGLDLLLLQLFGRWGNSNVKVLREAVKWWCWWWRWWRWVCECVRVGGLEERGRGSWGRGRALNRISYLHLRLFRETSLLWGRKLVQKSKKTSGWYILQHQLWVWFLSENSQLCRFWVQFGFRWGHWVSWTFSFLNSAK